MDINELPIKYGLIYGAVEYNHYYLIIDNIRFN